MEQALRAAEVRGRRWAHPGLTCWPSPTASRGSPSPRQLACHVGCAPFENRSGTSIRGRTRVSHNANHTLKALLHVSVVAVTRNTGEFRAYYDRKVAEGKHKMLVFNAMRNKLIHRVCAVIRKGVPYEIRTPLHTS
ncbi:MAG: IS110 family transposase [Flavobacteriales bacterium]|nr:IS110 family transposase [Flavobacteriales bacterium]